MFIDDLNLEELRNLGWDGDPLTLEYFKQRVINALALGWDRFEMTLEEFEEQDKEPTEEERRKRAEEAGWDEEEMDLEEFEDLFM